MDQGSTTTPAAPARRPWVRRLSRAVRLGAALPLVGSALLIGASYAGAYWTTPARGEITTTLATMTPPSAPTAVPAGADVTLAWSAAALSTGEAPEGYYATRDGGPTTCGTPDAPITSTTCTDTGVPDGAHTYTVTAVHRTWTAVGAPSGPVVVDTTPPTVVATVTPAPTAGGFWVTRPVTVTLVASDGEAGSGVASVTAWVGDGARTTTSGTTASVTFGADGTFVVSALATDVSGVSSTPVTTTVVVDTTPPAVSLTRATSPITRATSGTAVAEGTVEAGATLVVTATDGTRTTSPRAAHVAGTSWTSDPLDVTSLLDGPITYTATATDAAGHVATSELTVLKDTVAPAVGIAPATAPITAASQRATAWAGTVEPGARVAVTATDGAAATAALPATVVAGTWTVAGLDVSGLADGTLTLTATAVDPAGNTSVATATATKDAAVSPLTVATLDGPVTHLTETGTAASGTVEAGSAVTVVASDGAGHSVTRTATVTGTAWGAVGIDVSTLEDGALTYTVTATDGVGNTAQVSATTAKDTRTTFSVTAAASPTAGTPFTVTLTALTATGARDTTYAGTKAVTLAGPGVSPAGTAPGYPDTVTFTAGVGSLSLTATRAETVALTASQGATTGTSGPVTVRPGAASRLAWTAPVLSAGTPSTPCLFTCAVTAFGNDSTFTTTVSVTDAHGNTVSDIGTGHRVSVRNSGAGDVTPGSSFTVPSSGPAVTTATVVYTSRPSGKYSTDTVTVTTSSGTTYQKATATFTR